MTRSSHLISFFSLRLERISTFYKTKSEHVWSNFSLDRKFYCKENKGNKKLTLDEDYLDKLIKETKKKVNKQMSVNKNLLSLPQIIPFNTDGMTESEKRLRRDMIIKIRNYIDCFSDNEIIQTMCGNVTLFKQKLYEKDLAALTIIYEEIMIGINQSKDFEQFMYLFSSTLQITEFVSSISWE